MNIDNMIIHAEESSQNVDEHNEPRSKRVKICKKNLGRGWNCKTEAVEGYSFCLHHLNLVRTYHTNSTNNATSNAPRSMPSNNKPNVDMEIIQKAKSSGFKIRRLASCYSDDYLPFLKSNATKNDPPSENVEVVSEMNVDENNGSFRKRSRKMKNPVRAHVSNAGSSCSSGYCACYLGLDMKQDMAREFIANEEDAKKFLGEIGVATKNNEGPSAKGENENQLACVEGEEVERRNVCGRKRSRKMKHPKRSVIF